MPQVIDLLPEPNQSFSIQLEGRRYEFEIKEAQGAMGVTITRDGVRLVSNTRALPRTGLLPYRALEDLSGNFAFVTEDDELPDWRLFATSQRLLYFSNAEVVLIRNA